MGSLYKVFEGVVSESMREDLFMCGMEYIRAGQYVRNAYDTAHGMGKLKVELLKHGMLSPLGRIDEGLRGIIGTQEVEPTHGHFFGVGFEGSQILKHTDEVSRDDRKTVRVNLYVSLPVSGGMPVNDGELTPVTEHDVVVLVPDQFPHWSEEYGPGIRMLLSFGYHVPHSWQIDETIGGKLCALFQ